MAENISRGAAEYKIKSEQQGTKYKRGAAEDGVNNKQRGTRKERDEAQAEDKIPSE